MLIVPLCRLSLWWVLSTRWCPLTVAPCGSRPSHQCYIRDSAMLSASWCQAHVSPKLAPFLVFTMVCTLSSCIRCTWRAVPGAASSVGVLMSGDRRGARLYTALCGLVQFYGQQSVFFNKTIQVQFFIFTFITVETNFFFNLMVTNEL